MVELGKKNVLKVLKEVDFGVYLDGADLGEILLPQKYVPNGCQIDDELDVFLYRDSEDRIIATTIMPKAAVGDFAYLRVVSIEKIGAFMDWGLPKDLFVPFREQYPKMEKDNSYVVRILIDEQSDRIIASSRIDRYVNDDPEEFYEGQKVHLLIAGKTDLGYKAIIKNSHMGIIFNNDVFQSLSIGDNVPGYIKKIRDDDKIDLCFHKPGYKKVDGLAKGILDALKNQGGYIAVNDKSPPEIIYKLFKMSKKSYKKAIGSLYKNRLITIESKGIKLNEEN